MDLSNYTLDLLLQTAIKSEVESEKIYKKVADSIENAFLKEKFIFLSKEEEKHREYLEDLYWRIFPDVPLKFPKISYVPLPEIKITSDTMPLSEIIEQAMKAELATKEFYSELANKFTDEDVIKYLKLFSSMEMGHYRLLEIEKKNIEQFESWSEYNPMVHIGA